MSKKESERNQKKKKSNHVSFRAMIIAMIAALLAFLGIGNYDLGNGDGADLDDGTGTVIEEQVDGDSAETSEEVVEEKPEETEEDQSQEEVFNIFVRENKVLVGTADDLTEVTIDELGTQLDELESGYLVVIYDDGSVKRVYDEVEEMVDSKDVRKVEEKME